MTLLRDNQLSNKPIKVVGCNDPIVIGCGCEAGTGCGCGCGCSCNNNVGCQNC